MPQLAAERRLGDRDPELFEEPLRQIDQPPTHDAMQGRNRPIFHDLPQGLALALVEDAGSARRFAGQETIRTFGVETDNPVNLHPYPADPCRIAARAAVKNLGRCQETPGLIGITRSPDRCLGSNPTTTSSTIAASPGISSSTCPGKSCPSGPENGSTGHDHHAQKPTDRKKSF